MASSNTVHADLQSVLDKTVDNKKIFGTAFALKANGATWQGAAGNMDTEQPYFIASTTKLFTTALVLRLKSDGQLGLGDKIAGYLDRRILEGLHSFKGKDYANDLTIEHLLAHTSGLPDYFQGKGANGKSLEDELVGGHDQYWSFEQAIERTKRMKPLFAPGAKGKANYSDANFQLLGKVVETITGKSFAENCEERIIKPLKLPDTYLYTDASDDCPQPLHYKATQLNIPKAMTSFGPDGGMVSTSADMLTFVEAFFTGALFPADSIDGLQVWNRIFFPMRAGIGIHLFRLPWIFNPMGAVPYFIGHSGLSGALAYYCPEKNLFIAGTVNQVAHPDVSFRTMIKLAQVWRNKG